MLSAYIFVDTSRQFLELLVVPSKFYRMAGIIKNQSRDVDSNQEPQVTSSARYLIDHAVDCKLVKITRYNNYTD